jgi:hypothetical protein
LAEITQDGVVIGGDAKAGIEAAPLLDDPAAEKQGGVRWHPAPGGKTPRWINAWLKQGGTMAMLAV